LTAPFSLTPDQEHAAARVDALDLESVVFGLMHPDPGLTVMDLAEADQVVAAYRGWLKLCAWYPEEPLVPTLSIDDAWRAHLADTAKYARDCQAAFGRFAHCYPYYGHGVRKAAWHRAYQRTRDLFCRHFGTDMPGTAPGDDEDSHPDAECCTGGSGCIRVFGDEAGTVWVLDRERPGPLRSRPNAAPARRAEPVLAGHSPLPAGTAPMPGGSR
jgi:hypothetical protein